MGAVMIGSIAKLRGFAAVVVIVLICDELTDGGKVATLKVVSSGGGISDVGGADASFG